MYYMVLYILYYILKNCWIFFWVWACLGCSHLPSSPQKNLQFFKYHV